MAVAPKYYLDSCVFIHLISDDSYSPTIKSILEDCEQGKCEIYTSQLTIAEVAYAAQERDSRALDLAIEARIDTLWHPDSPIKLIEVHYHIVSEAKNLVREALTRRSVSNTSFSLKPTDAIHFATAVQQQSSEFFTYDERLFGFGNLVGMPIVRPHVEPDLFNQGKPS